MLYKRTSTGCTKSYFEFVFTSCDHNSERNQTSDGVQSQFQRSLNPGIPYIPLKNPHLRSIRLVFSHVLLPRSEIRENFLDKHKQRSGQISDSVQLKDLMVKTCYLYTTSHKIKTVMTTKKCQGKKLKVFANTKDMNSSNWSIFELHSLFF